MQETTDNQKKHLSWWLVMLEGIVVFILGILLIAYPDRTVTILLFFLGIYLLVIGILRFVQVFRKHQYSVWKLVTGILAILVGIFIIANRFMLAPATPLILAYATAIVVLLDGIVHLIPIFKPSDNESQSYGSPVMGLFEILFGIILFFIPHLTASVIYVTVALGAIIGGIVLFFYSFNVRKKDKQ